MDGASKFVKGDAIARPASSPRSTSSAASCVGVVQQQHPLRRGDAHLLAADRRRRPRRADPRAADLGRDRHPGDPLGVREGPRLGPRQPDPPPAQGAAGRRRACSALRARSRACPSCRSCSSAGSWAAIGWSVRNGMPDKIAAAAAAAALPAPTEARQARGAARGGAQGAPHRSARARHRLWAGAARRSPHRRHRWSGACR